MPEPTLSELDARLNKLQAEFHGAAASKNFPVATGVSTSKSAKEDLADTVPASASSPIEQLDNRIAKSSANEGLALLIVREGLVAQFEVQEDRKHVRALERRNFYAKIALSFTALAGGAGFVATGFALPGFVCIGAGLYALAPSFIDRVTDRVLGSRKP